MEKQLNCVLLIDDNPDDNFFHSRAIKMTKKVKEIVALETGFEALEYLRNHADHKIDLIFLDINMPGMNGWEFMEKYEKLDPAQKAHIVVVMLTTSINPNDREKAKNTNSINSFLVKPLTAVIFNSLLKNYFPHI